GGIAVSDRGPYKITAGAYGAPDGSAWFDEVSLTERRKPAVDVYLLYPNFRGMLFEDRPQVVRVAVGAAQGARVRLALVDGAGGGGGGWGCGRGGRRGGARARRHRLGHGGARRRRSGRQRLAAARRAARRERGGGIPLSRPPDRARVGEGP